MGAGGAHVTTSVSVTTSAEEKMGSAPIYSDSGGSWGFKATVSNLGYLPEKPELLLKLVLQVSLGSRKRK
jgi:hypothetical protein